VKSQFGVSGYHFEISIRLQYVEVGSHGDSGDQAVVARAYCFAGPTTPPIERCGLFEITQCFNCHKPATPEQPAQLRGVRLVTGTGEDLHHDDVGRVQ